MFDFEEAQRKEDLYMKNAKRQEEISEILNGGSISDEERNWLIEELNECGEYTGVYWE